MIIRAEIADYDVGRVLIDTGSLVNVIFADAFKGLGIADSMVNRQITPLLSFSGDLVQPVGSISLPIAFDLALRKTMTYDQFLIVDSPTLASLQWLIVQELPNGSGPIDDPREETSAPIAQPAEELETVVLNEDFPDRWVKIGTSLDPEIRRQFIDFLRQQAEVFAWSYDDMPGISPDVISHKLSISTAHKPVRQKRRSYDAERYQAMRAEVDKLKAIGFIREATYPVWLANSVMVRKAKEGWRMCQDYTDLNKACPKDNFPLPRINQLVDTTTGHELLSFMDAYSGYNQIFMDPANREHMVFITDRGLYCYNVMPFGLKNAGATYQRLVNRIFTKHIGGIMEVYVEDMLVKSRTAGGHLENLALMFGILKDYRMRLNPTKCAFDVSYVLQKPETSGRLVKWAIELGEFDIQFKPRPAEKGQVIADFISELILALSESPFPSAILTAPERTDAERFDTSVPLWILHVDGSANQQGCGAGLVLTTPNGGKVEYALRFNFRTSNNEAEYEALLAGLRLAKSMSAK
ncbi:PREDICTED: uncharacterized protein LOC107880249 [Prunus mume]|uniref:Uncharacterized protein LOC107880249 n=1 Tax=Prunus mume TaxID=102107 RepID=A0ABM1LHR9_PRUMU|nr:PREDICTED: uncharacterized protein LOC107880249 [Prunus mume]